MTSRRPSPSLVVASLALLLATGSTSYAAGLGRNSVGTQQLRNGAVASGKIRNGAVTTARIGNNAVTGPKVKDGSIGRNDLAGGIALPLTVNVTRTVPHGEERAIATVGGIAYSGDCAIDGSGLVVRAQLFVKPAAPGAPAGSLSGVWTSSVSDKDGDFTEASGSGVASTIGLVALGSSSTDGDGTLSGVLQYRQLPATRVDLGITAVGAVDPFCRFTVVATPTR